MKTPKKPLNKRQIASAAPVRQVESTMGELFDKVPRPDDQWGPWVKWDGNGSPPIWLDSVVRLRLRCGTIVTNFVFTSTWQWGIGGTNERDIIEYCVLKPH